MAGRRVLPEVLRREPLATPLVLQGEGAQRNLVCFRPMSHFGGGAFRSRRPGSGFGTAFFRGGKCVATTISDRTGTQLQCGADILVQSLVNHGVEVIFAYPGGASMPLHQSLTQYKDQIRTILPRHEQGGGFAAQGYARTTGKPGVCMATSGPGATNLVTVHRRRQARQHSADRHHRPGEEQPSSAPTPFRKRRSSKSAAASPSTITWSPTSTTWPASCARRFTSPPPAGRARC